MEVALLLDSLRGQLGPSCEKWYAVLQSLEDLAAVYYGDSQRVGVAQVLNRMARFFLQCDELPDALLEHQFDCRTLDANDVWMLHRTTSSLMICTAVAA